MESQFRLKTLFLLLFILLYVLPAQSQQTRLVSINSFQKVSVASGIDLYLTQGNTESIKVIAHEDLINDVIVEKAGTLLKIRYKDNISWSRIVKGQNIKAYVTFKTLTAISASGGSDIYGQNSLKAQTLNIAASGGSDIKLNVTSQDLEVNTSGGSDVELKGRAINMTVNISGGSDIDALELLVDYARVTASGGSDANVNVSKGLEANASGGSDVNYKGNASVNRTSSSKSSDVKKLK
ncbi:MAG: head GIN domain-containing protein [Pedobacter sp.]